MWGSPSLQLQTPIITVFKFVYCVASNNICWLRNRMSRDRGTWRTFKRNFFSSFLYALTIGAWWKPWEWCLRKELLPRATNISWRTSCSLLRRVQSKPDWHAQSNCLFKKCHCSLGKFKVSTSSSSYFIRRVPSSFTYCTIPLKYWCSSC